MEDKVVVWRALSDREDALSFLKQLKVEMEAAFDQKKILIVARQVLCF